MQDVAYRILLNVPDEVPKLEVMLFAEQLYRLRSLGVRWDLIVISQTGRHRSVEIIIYQDTSNSNHEDATVALTTWFKSNKLEYRLLGDLVG